MDAPGELTSGLAVLLDTYPTKQLVPVVQRLIESYRGGTPTAAPVLSDRLHVAAYAAYRMPATFAAARMALGEVARLAGDWAPRSQLDVGGGTGAATWAAADVWASLSEATVVDWSAPTLAVGRELAADSVSPSVAAASWRQVTLDDRADLPPADLVTLSYVLGELAEASRAALVGRLIDLGRPIVVVEPGTPAGYRRVLAARDAMIAAGMSVIAPCPHSGPCPMARTDDWCHFSVRVNRSSLHRQLKEAALSYEDEKFSYVAAMPAGVVAAPARVVRHPHYRKGLVQLELCTAGNGLVSEPVSKRQGDRYRAARDLHWGDPWQSASASAMSHPDAPGPSSSWNDFAS